MGQSYIITEEDFPEYEVLSVRTKAHLRHFEADFNIFDGVSLYNI